jgi:hypothetical protein
MLKTKFRCLVNRLERKLYPKGRSGGYYYYAA